MCSAAVTGSLTPWTEQETTSVEPVRIDGQRANKRTGRSSTVRESMLYEGCPLSLSPAGMIPSGSTGFTGSSGESASS